jgi:drug/metabolite transporter (DMT)-like permease
MNAGLLYGIGAAVTWGVVYTLDQKILTTTSPMTLLFINSVITAIVMPPVIFIEHDSIKELFSTGKANLVLVGISILLAALANFFIFASIKSIGASSASIIEIAYPLFVVIISFIVFRTLPSIPVLIGGTFIFIGAAIIGYFH